jgi:hypothetical protein
MRLNDASGVPHHPGRISAPVRAREARPYPYSPDVPRRCKREHAPAPTPLARAHAEARYAHHHGRADNAGGIGTSIPEIC